jgi:nucleoside 2-deoxyribosyltransferase
MKMFITATFKEDKNKTEIEKLCSIVKQAGFDDFCFIRDVENYKKTFSNPTDLMENAKNEISKCDILLYDGSKKSTGRAIELGIAYCLHKKIIIIKNTNTKIKDSLSGTADKIINYKNIEDIKAGLEEAFLEWS